MINKYLYILYANIICSPIGTLVFRLTEKRFKNDKTSTAGDIWWYGYLLNYASRYDLNKIKKESRSKVAVRTIMPNYDFFLFYNTVFHLDCVSHIIYELSQGKIPVIDDTYRVWTQFFEQPLLPVGEKEIPSLPSSDEKSTLHTPTYIAECKKVRKIWSKLLNDFCRLNEKEKQYIDNEISEILGDEVRALGIVLRGTDYKAANFWQPEVSEVISEAKKWMTKYNYDKIYLATEDESIFKKFNEALPGQILVNKRTYYDKALSEQNKVWIGQVHFNRENDDYLKGLEYLSSIYIVSRCKALLAGKCGASGMALLLNNEKYEHFKIYSK